MGWSARRRADRRVALARPLTGGFFTSVASGLTRALGCDSIAGAGPRDADAPTD